MQGFSERTLFHFQIEVISCSDGEATVFHSWLGPQAPTVWPPRSQASSPDRSGRDLNGKFGQVSRAVGLPSKSSHYYNASAQVFRGSSTCSAPQGNFLPHLRSPALRHLLGQAEIQLSLLRWVSLSGHTKRMRISFSEGSEMKTSLKNRLYAQPKTSSFSFILRRVLIGMWKVCPSNLSRKVASSG